MTTSEILAAYYGVAAQSSEASVLRLIVELGAQVVGADEGSLLVLDAGARELVFAMTVGSNISEATLVGQRVPLGQGLTGLAAATGEVQIGAPTFAGVKQAKERAPADEGPEAVLAAPMLVGERLIGVITAVSFQPGRRFDSEHGQLYGRLATVAALVVDQHRRLQGGVPMNDPVDDDERAIAASIARLAQFGPEAVGAVRAMLAQIETLVITGRGR
jgi:GAF domain-containing protein